MGRRKYKDDCYIIKKKNLNKYIKIMKIKKLLIYLFNFEILL